MDNKHLSTMLLNEIEDKLVDLFTGKELIRLTTDYAEEIGKEVTYRVVGYNSKKDILSRNIADLGYEGKIGFFREILKLTAVKKDEALVTQINDLLPNDNLANKKARDDVTTILSKYPSNVVETWNNAVKFFDQSDYRDSLDSIRLTLELVVKEILRNNKSLEHQTEEMGKYLKSRGINKEFRNLFFKVLDMYTKIQNDFAKHSTPDELEVSEIRFLMNQAVLVMKFLDECR
ncbi:hypothetical protein [Lactobacillus delbrueckii]|uniref:hypothetical protein n=1 Tax=Lactobacillus delbrueckii TaxID=1584 RepID=UPI001F339E5B|nr:hypothetical protein [Lactobacillus delbrueckii]MDK8262143.1 hypothetical protein [Lactobacillus delbrueckii]GHN17324.1 hypothetical protein ME782_17850 [Lactobacillus delbrueckii]